LKYDTHQNKILTDLQFVGYEDYLGAGLYDGFSSILVPGSGEPNFDSFEVNVFQSKKQKAEDQVAKLLDKVNENFEETKFLYFISYLLILLHWILQLLVQLTRHQEK